MTEAIAEEKKSLAQVVPAGCTERKLNFRDRTLIFEACLAYANKDSKADQKMARRIEKLRRKLAFDEVADYYDDISEKYDDIGIEYVESLNRYTAYKNLKAGGRTKEDILKQYPDFDFTKEIKKPLRKRPEPTKEEQRGEEKSFIIKTTMDAWIIAALNEMKGINLQQSEYWAELADKFGLEDDSLDWNEK